MYANALPKDRQQTALDMNFLPSITRKRSLDEVTDKENQTEDSASLSKKQKQVYSKRCTNDEKLKDVLTCITVLLTRPGGYSLPFCFLFSITVM